VYGYGGSVVLPIFNAGSLWANYKASKAQREAAILSYQKSVQEAFRDTADSLVGYQKAREYRVQRELFATTLRDQLRLADLRYRGGVCTRPLEVAGRNEHLRQRTRKCHDNLRSPR
jgi:multidrug efflux system outer membrane protein